MASLVVLEANLGAVHAPRMVWAWGLVDDGPGFTELTFTEPDGRTFVDAPDDVTLGAHLFTVELHR